MNYKKGYNKYYRDLGNKTFNECDQLTLAKEMDKHTVPSAKKYPLITAVNKASKNKAYFGISGNKKDPTIAVVGKGLVYDTGGLNMKRTGSIENMHTDKLGACATVLASKYLKRSDTVYVIGCASNETGTAAYKPGNRYAVDGHTVRVHNTDAEGRLVLADTVRYVQHTFPTVTTIITIATLTGLSHSFFGNRDVPVMVSGALPERKDRLVFLPIRDEDVSDLHKDEELWNSGGDNNRGAITAAGFISNFINADIHFYHADIAGCSPKGYLITEEYKPIKELIGFIKQL